MSYLKQFEWKQISIIAVAALIAFGLSFYLFLRLPDFGLGCVAPGLLVLVFAFVATGKYDFVIGSFMAISLVGFVRLMSGSATVPVITTEALVLSAVLPLSAIYGAVSHLRTADHQHA